MHARNEIPSCDIHAPGRSLIIMSTCGIRSSHRNCFVCIKRKILGEEQKLWSSTLLYVSIYPFFRKFRGVKLTSHLHLVLRSRMRGSIPPLPQHAFMVWCSGEAQEQIYLCSSVNPCLTKHCCTAQQINLVSHNTWFRLTTGSSIETPRNQT
jgi:hypothetical protein